MRANRTPRMMTHKDTNIDGTLATLKGDFLADYRNRKTTIPYFPLGQSVLTSPTHGIGGLHPRLNSLPATTGSMAFGNQTQTKQSRSSEVIAHLFNRFTYRAREQRDFICKCAGQSV